MKRTLTSALAAAVVALGAAGHVQAQDMTVRTAPLFDIGIFGGGAWTSNWFTIGDNGYKPGFSPVFGAEATYWLSPTFGIRLDGKYLPEKLPQNSNTFTSDRWLSNDWFYDLDLLWRPMFWSSNGGFLSSMYVFLGGGALTSDPVGKSQCVGLAIYVGNGVCVPDSPKIGTVGQGVAGLGFDVFPITSAIGIFLEGGVHGYDSPAHVADNAQNAEDKFAFTPYAVLGLKVGFGNIIPPPPPPPPPPEVTPVAPPPPATVNVCVVQNGALTTVTGTFDPTTNDTTGLPAAEANAQSATWFINNEPITFNGHRYVKYGLPRVLNVGDVNNIGTYQGVAVFAEPSANATSAEVIYVPVGSRCEFQPYQIERKAGAVRG